MLIVASMLTVTQMWFGEYSCSLLQGQINSLKANSSSSSESPLNIIVLRTVFSSPNSIISSQLCVCVYTHAMCGLWSLLSLCGCLASRKARWASVAEQSPVHLMTRPHAKLMWTSRSGWAHSEHAQISPRLQRTTVNRTALVDLLDNTVTSSWANSVGEFKMTELPSRPLLCLLQLSGFAIEVGVWILTTRGRDVYIVSTK